MSRYDREAAALDALRSWGQRHPILDRLLAALIFMVLTFPVWGLALAALL